MFIKTVPFFTPSHFDERSNFFCLGSGCCFGGGIVIYQSAPATRGALLNFLHINYATGMELIGPKGILLRVPGVRRMHYCQIFEWAT